jgi:hypothetical protein
MVGETVTQGGWLSPAGVQSIRLQVVFARLGQTQSSVQITPKVKGLRGSVLAFKGGQPDSTPVFGSRFTHAGMPVPVSTSQKKTLFGGFEQVQHVAVNVGPTKGMHSCKGGEFQRGGLMSKIACTGFGFSAMPPIASDKAIIVTRHNLKKTAALGRFLKFHVLICLPPYLCHRKDF